MILVECYGDEALVKYLGAARVDHNYGVGNISKRLEKGSGKKALIDADPGKTKPNYINSLKQVGDARYSVSVWIDEKKSNKVIKIDPDLEGFLFQVFEETKTKELLKKYGFKDTLNGLHSDLSSEGQAKKLPKLLAEIEVQKKSQRLEALRNALKDSI